MKFILLPLLVLASVAPGATQATTIASVRVGDHPTHSRVVFDWPQPTVYSVEEERERGRVMLRFPEGSGFDLEVARPPRHLPLRVLHAVEAEGSTATLLSVPGVRVRHFRLGGRVVVDLRQPEDEQRPAEAASTAGGNPLLVLAQATAPLPAQRPLVPSSSNPLLAQAPAAPAAPAGSAVGPTATGVRIESGTGRLLSLPAPASTVMTADPRVVRVQPSSPTSIFVMAGAPGRTTIIATNETGQAVAEFDVNVFAPGVPAAATGAPGAPATRNVSAAAIESQIRALVPSPGQVRVRVAGKVIVLTGTVPTAADARRAEAIARGMGEEDTQILNEIGVLASIQVNLRVRVAEISRDITRQFGFNWQAIGQSGNFAFGLRGGAAGFPLATAATAAGLGSRFETGLNTGAGSTTSIRRLGAGFSSGGWDVNGLVDALAIDNLVTILAEPNLTAQSGEVASFLAGGEFPVPVSASATGQIGIEFKAFGVSLAFVPTVLSNERLTLRVRPEVSELSDQGAINVPIANGAGTVRIPALTVRRAETTVELGSGQSFAIAGLLQRGSLQTTEGINGLSDIPVLGALFRSDRFQRRETELVIIVTPYLVQPVSDPAALAAPTDDFRPATSLERILMQRQITSTPRPVPGVPQGVGFRLN